MEPDMLDDDTSISMVNGEFRIKLNIPNVPRPGDRFVVPADDQVHTVVEFSRLKAPPNHFEVRDSIGSLWEVAWRVPDSGGDGHWFATRSLDTDNSPSGT
jgi:hypothetical protein